MSFKSQFPHVAELYYQMIIDFIRKETVGNMHIYKPFFSDINDSVCDLMNNYLVRKQY